MKTKLIAAAKWLVLLAVLAGVAWTVHKQLGLIGRQGAGLHWRWPFGPLAVAGFAGVFLTSGLVWLWLTRQMGHRGPVPRLLGAYTFSQMGKYFPGKVVLLLMRIERTGRLGMRPEVCTLSTLVENALYMVSGALVAGITALIYAGDRLEGYAHEHPAYLIALAAAGVPLLALAHPRVFYGIVNKALARFGRPAVDKAHQLSVWKLTRTILLFVPCWLFGGLSLWACLRCTGIPPGDVTLAILPGTFAAAVIGGMAVGVSPGGLGPREAIQAGLLLTVMPAGDAVSIGVAVVLQRLAQVVTELALGAWGAWVTRGARALNAAR